MASPAIALSAPRSALTLAPRVMPLELGWALQQCKAAVHPRGSSVLSQHVSFAVKFVCQVQVMDTTLQSTSLIKGPSTVSPLPGHLQIQ